MNFIVEMMFLFFLVLKLTHTVDWWWWWVTSPLWSIPAIFIIAMIPMAIAETVMERK